MTQWTDEQKAWWDFLLHAEKILTDRTNFFLLAQSIFVSAFVILIGGHFDTRLPFVSVLVWGGMSISFIWLLLGIKIFVRQGGIAKKVKGFFPDYEAVTKKYDIPYVAFISNLFISFFIPVIFLIIWSVIVWKT